MKYQIEAFRDGAVDGVALDAGAKLADIKTFETLTVAQVQRAVSTGLAEVVPVREEQPAEGESKTE